MQLYWYLALDVSILCTITHLCPFSKSKFNLYQAKSLTASTLLHRLVLFLELGTVQTGTGKIDPALKFKCTTAPVTSKVGYILHFTFSRCLVHNVIWPFSGKFHTLNNFFLTKGVPVEIPLRGIAHNCRKPLSFVN